MENGVTKVLAGEYTCIAQLPSIGLKSLPLAQRGLFFL
jgi:hypothetical protein